MRHLLAVARAAGLEELSAEVLADNVAMLGVFAKSGLPMTTARDGGVRAAAMATLIATAKLDDVDPLAWLADVLARIAGMPQSRLAELLAWNRQAAQPQAA
jgi:hypothetical protein